MRPNILLILTDQYRYDCLSCLGHPVVRTPNLDALASDALMLTSAYAASMACGPSRACLFTGMYADRHGQRKNQQPFNPPDLVGFPQLLRDAGYDTALVGKLHLKPMDRDFGFTHNLRHDGCQNNYDPEEPRRSAYIHWLAQTAYRHDPEAPIRFASADEACLQSDQYRFIMGSNWIVDESHHETVWTARQTARFIEQPREKPFFAQCSFFGPHQPFLCPGRWGVLYEPASIPLPEQFHAPSDDKPILRGKSTKGLLRNREEAGWDEDAYRRVLAAYYGNISMIDHYLGEVFDALRRSGQWDRTLIIFTADHGDYAGQFRHFYKGSGYEGSAHVPMIVRHPYFGRRGERDDSPVSLMDLFATCLSAGEAITEDSAGRDSRDFTPLLRGEHAAWDNAAWFKSGDCSMLVLNRFKLMRGPSVEGETVYEFYDLDEHPREWTNRINSEAHQAAIRAMRPRLDEFHARQEKYSEAHRPRQGK